MKWMDGTDSGKWEKGGTKSYGLRQSMCIFLPGVNEKTLLLFLIGNPEMTELVIPEQQASVKRPRNKQVIAVQLMNSMEVPHRFEDVVKRIQEACEFPTEAQAVQMYNWMYRNQHTGEHYASNPFKKLRDDYVHAKREGRRSPTKAPAEMTAERKRLFRDAAARVRKKRLDYATRAVEALAQEGAHRALSAEPVVVTSHEVSELV